MAATTRTQGKEAESRIDRVSDSAHEAIDRAAAAASSVAGRISDTGDALMEMPQNWIDDAREYVREHPLASLGMALAAGYILSMIMRSND
jgi:ElaB/YqjD/DUF883 family membrane-anchored ribosome-binding protein